MSAFQHYFWSAAATLISLAGFALGNRPWQQLIAGVAIGVLLVVLFSPVRDAAPEQRRPDWRNVGSSN